MNAESKALWHGRFDGGPAAALMAFTASLPFDVRLATHDVEGSKAHVRGLAKAGLLTDDEKSTIVHALEQTGQEIEAGELVFVDSDEDIHTAIERRVTELAGAVGGKLHTGRSRNDQVATAFRLWLRHQLAAVTAETIELQRTLLGAAEAAGTTYLPGYTHMQRAQPVPLAHHLGAHAWALARDIDRLLDAGDRLDVSPLGAGALAGSSLPLDPAVTAADLGFGAVFDNSLDATSDRDFVAEALFVIALLGVHLSRLGEEWVLWSSSEFGFVAIDDGYATGSSMMPQKKNPDIAELTRGKSGRLIGNLTGLLATLKGLPLSYNRDLQEDKEPVFDSVDQVRLALVAMSGMIGTSTFDAERMAEAADDQTALATDLAEILVAGGLPFRDAHAVVGGLVKSSIESGRPLSELVAEDAAFAESDIAAAIDGLFEPGAALARRQSPGGAGTGPVAEQLQRLAERIDADAARLEAAGWSGHRSALS